MEPLVRVEPDELASLAMENQLLRYEVHHLRAKLAEGKRARKSAKEEAADPSGPSSDEARADLVALLERLDQSPAGPLLRHRSGIKALREKYLGGSAE